VVETVGDGLDHLGFGHALAQAQIAGQQAQNEKGAGHRQQNQQSEHGHLARAADEQRDNKAAAGHQAKQKQERAGRISRTAPANPRRGRRQIVACLHVYHGG